MSTAEKDWDEKTDIEDFQFLREEMFTWRCFQIMRTCMRLRKTMKAKMMIVSVV